MKTLEGIDVIIILFYLFYFIFPSLAFFVLLSVKTFFIISKSRTNRLGSIVTDFDIIYDSSNVEFEKSIVRACKDLASGTNLRYDGSTVAAKTGLLFYLFAQIVVKLWNMRNSS